ncbi:ComF family protein [Sedimenticola sp.]|uniref:ComF family protein n=1 Tax=Sedimenticola sp. TaxID=1940285 RepID=UPI003D13A4E5
MVYNCTNNILSLLYPAPCLLCDTPAQDAICPDCQADLPHNRHSCRCCGLPLTLADEATCGHCLAHPPAVDRSFIPYLYAAPIDQLIGRFKFSGQLAQGRLLSRLLADHLRQRAEMPDLLIPVPLHPQRLRQRGYNQALELAKPLARQLGLALDHQSCRRIQPTPPQHELKKHQRKRNIRGAFQVTRTPAVNHVALVDDVVTTGSTVNELAKCLKQRGVARVDVWAVARTP